MQNEQFNPLQGLWSTVCRLFLLTTFFVGFGMLATPDVKANLTGAIYTTAHDPDTDECTGVNVNIFGFKADVYLDGGPAGSGSGLPDSPLPVGTPSYYCKVTAPDGTVLGVSNGPVIEVRGGKFVDCYQLIDILYKFGSDPSDLGFLTTNSNGGVYKVWVSTDPTFPGGSTKTDNFKVLDDDDPNTPPPPPASTGELCVVKFYDANVNGVFDPHPDTNPNEVVIPGWLFEVTGSPLVGPSIDPVLLTTTSDHKCIILDVGSYSVEEFKADQNHWANTSLTIMPVELPATLPGFPITVEFGNVCIGAGGGKTLGFWSNKNGAKVFGVGPPITPAYGVNLDLLEALNLVYPNGDSFDPPSYASFKTWLLGAKATNMSYMLSAQLAAMALNNSNGLLTSGYIYAPGLLPYQDSGVNDFGFISVSGLIAAANAALGADGYTPAGDEPNRSYQEALKNALDKANNNLNFVEPVFNPAHCPYSFDLMRRYPTL